MKVLRKLFSGLFQLILVSLITLLSISIMFKNVLYDGIVKEVVIQQFSGSNNMESDLKELEELDETGKFRELMEIKEVKDLFNKYVDIAVGGLVDENTINEIDLEKDIKDLLVENAKVKEVIGEDGVNKIIEELDKNNFGSEINNSFKESVLNNKNDLNKEEVMVLNIFKTLGSNSFKITLLILIAIDLLLIALCQLSLYKWIKSFSISLITSGVLLSIMSLFVQMIVVNVSKYNINMYSLLYFGIGLIIVGILILVTYNIVGSIIKSNNNDSSNNTNKTDDNTNIGELNNEIS